MANHNLWPGQTQQPKTLETAAIGAMPDIKIPPQEPLQAQPQPRQEPQKPLRPQPVAQKPQSDEPLYIPGSQLVGRLFRRVRGPQRAHISQPRRVFYFISGAVILIGGAGLTNIYLQHLFPALARNNLGWVTLALTLVISLIFSANELYIWEEGTSPGEKLLGVGLLAVDIWLNVGGLMVYTETAALSWPNAQTIAILVIGAIFAAYPEKLISQAGR
jgi:hypothetical protein